MSLEDTESFILFSLSFAAYQIITTYKHSEVQKLSLEVATRREFHSVSTFGLTSSTTGCQHGCQYSSGYVGSNVTKTTSASEPEITQVSCLRCTNVWC